MSAGLNAGAAPPVLQVRDLARSFGGLRAGQVVFLGSVTPPIWIDGPGSVVVEFDTLGKVSLEFV